MITETRKEELDDIALDEACRILENVWYDAIREVAYEEELPQEEREYLYSVDMDLEVKENIE